MKYNFEQDVEESSKYVQKVSLSSTEGFSVMDHGIMLDIVWNKFQKKSWWIILVPWYIEGLESEIEDSFYSPKSGKNAGFELIPLVDSRLTIVFAHKSCMNDKQLSAVINKFGGNVYNNRIDEDGGDFLICGDTPSLRHLYLELLDYFHKQSSHT